MTGPYWTLQEVADHERSERRRIYAVIATWALLVGLLIGFNLGG